MPEAPPLPGPDWVAVQPFPFAAARKSFAGAIADELLELAYYKRPDGTLVAVAAFGALSEGAPGQVHGGIILTVLDEALGAAAWMAGHPVLTVRLNTEFRKTIPVHAKLLVEPRITAVRHRLVFVEGSLLGPDGARFASAKAEFLALKEADQKRVFGR